MTCSRERIDRDASRSCAVPTQHLFLGMRPDLPGRPWLAAEGHRRHCRRHRRRRRRRRRRREEGVVRMPQCSRERANKRQPGIERAPPFMVSGRRRTARKPHGVARGRGSREITYAESPARCVGDVGDSEVERAGVKGGRSVPRAPARLGSVRLAIPGSTKGGTRFPERKTADGSL